MGRGNADGPGSFVAGIDLGSTALKMLVLDRAGAEVVSEQVPTPWRGGADGAAELDADAFLQSLQALLRYVARGLRELPGASVSAIAVAGMGETGFLIDGDGRVAAPAFAWFDPRGQAQADAFPETIREEFSGRTGLPLGSQVSAAKLAYLRDAGEELAGLRWLNLPEYVVHALGGDIAAEASLASRTGLLDQDTGTAWPSMLALLGVDESFLPEIRDAGTNWGTANGDLPPCMIGAHLTVAGHDHLVAAEATASLSRDHYYVSLGTAEVLLRVIDAPLGYEARRRLAGRLINEVRHVVPGKRVLVAGIKTGLLLRRLLQAVGVEDRPGRDAVDDAVMALPYDGALAAGAVGVSGARNDDGTLRITLRSDGVNPAELFAAVLRHSNDEIRLLIEAMDREIPPATTSTLTGGWAGMAAVQRARRVVLPGMTVSSRPQETAYGAALVARRLLRDAEARQ